MYILDVQSHPARSLYFIGGLVLRAFDDLGVEHATPFELHAKVFEIAEATPSGNAIPKGHEHFFLALDWLFLAGLVRESSHGRVKLCT